LVRIFRVRDGRIAMLRDYFAAPDADAAAAAEPAATAGSAGGIGTDKKS